MEFELWIGSEVFEEESDGGISYEKNPENLTRLWCFGLYPSVDDIHGDDKQYQPFEKACEEIGIYSQHGIYLGIDMEYMEVIKDWK